LRNFIVLERNGRREVTELYVRGVGGRLLRSHNHLWFLYNNRGDAVQRVDNAGQVLHTYRFSAFGVEINPDPSNSNPWRFNGEYHDMHRGGEIYLRARSFSPRLGRFTTPDPLFHALHGNLLSCPIQSGNLYMFVGHNPVMFVDPSGLVRVNTVEYAKAQGATITNLSPAADGRNRIRISYNGIYMNITVNSGFIDDSVLNNRFGWTNPFISSGNTEAAWLGAHGSPQNISAVANRNIVNHTSVIIFAGHDSSLLTGSFARYFVNSHFGMLYATLGAKSWEANAPRRRLEAVANSPADVNLSIKVTPMQHLHSRTDVILGLFTSFNYYQTNHNSSLTYWFFPGTHRYQFNSNSFTSGLLRTVGFVTPNIRPGVNVPGWDRPVPARYFGGYR